MLDMIMRVHIRGGIQLRDDALASCKIFHASTA
jgi:hypothetical protein